MVDTAQKDIGSQLDETTKMLNRVISLIRGNLDVNLDPQGELQMTDKEYNAHWAKIDKISADFDKRQKRVAGLTAQEIEEEISELEVARLVNALEGVANG